MAEADLSSIFERATVHVRGLGNASTSQMLQLYGLYKQATHGPNRTGRPLWINRTDRAKWDAWSSHGDKDMTTAMAEYIALVTSLDPDWMSCNSPSAGSWVHHSSLADSEEPISEADKTAFDWVRDNNVVELKKAVSDGIDLAALTDEEGLGLIHWAADRGHVESLKYLLATGIPANVLDPFGQTPLHYAASCGHMDVVKELLEAGAELSCLDLDGKTACDVAATVDISQLLRAAA